MIELLASVDRVACWLEQNGHKNSPSTLRQLVELARRQASAIETLRQEIIAMARTNQQNLEVVLGALKSAQDGAITDDQKAALAGLAAAANVITPDTTGAAPAGDAPAEGKQQG